MAKKKAIAALAASLPSGFVQMNSGSGAPIWQPKEGDILQGRVMKSERIDAKKAGREKAKKGETVGILTIADSDGVLYSVWESHALTQLMKDARPGDDVFIRLDRIKKTGKRRFKDFTVGLKKKGAK
jgi:hypothetical protein